MITAILCRGDVAAARGAVRATGLALGFPVPDLRLAQAVVSEMCLYAVSLGCPADLSVTALNRAGRAGISMVMQAPVEIPGKEFQDNKRTPGLGLAGAKRLSDHWEISIRSGKTTVHAIKWQPASAPAGLMSRYLLVIETAPHKAWDFGREAVLSGLSITAMAALHAEVMKHVSSPLKAQQCFEDVLAAFEMGYRGLSEARASMNGIHELLERETERIAQSLHDEAAQAMAALSLGVDGLECGKEVCAAQAMRLKVMVEEADNLFRALSHELRPPLLEDEGLAPALRGLCESFSSRQGVLRVDFRDDLQRRLDAPLEKAIYRTVQTALANVVRHAGATNAVVRIFTSGDSVLCSVRDNGRGLDPEQQSVGLGLRGVRERAAALGGAIELEAVLPHGLDIRIRLPDASTERRS